MGTVLVQLAVFLAVLTCMAIVLGNYMARVFGGEKTFLSSVLRPVEKFFYKIFGVDETKETDWKNYAFGLVALNLFGLIFLFILQKIQHLLPLNPQGFGSVRWDTALNTAVSFVTNTNWQSYMPESSMSYLTQMLGFTVQNFLSAAVGIAVVVAFFRAFTHKSTAKIGNFWVNLTRALLYVLLPLSILLSLLFVSQGVVQNLNPYVKARTLEGQEQVIAQGPAAAQVAIKVLGTNGGGFFNTNSAHPYENPNLVTNYAQILGFLVISAALPFTFGKLSGNAKQGIAVFSVMMTLYLIGLGGALWAEFHGNPFLSNLGVGNGLNLEGKELRFGIFNSILFAQSTTSVSCGAVNAMHDSLLPLSGLVTIFNMMIGEVIFGGVGVGFVAMIIYAVLTMFLVGLMIGRTPELFGKKLEPFEMIMAVIALLLPSVVQLTLGAVSLSNGFGLSSLHNGASHGLSEVVYAFASAAGNNGSAFAGLNANTPFYNLSLAFAMLIGRFGLIIPALAIAGSLAGKKFVPEETKFPATSPLFVTMLVCVVIIVGALTFFPVLVIGPILEHLLIVS